MSLLNDALRKKRREHQPENTSLKASLPKLDKWSSRKVQKKILVVACTLVLAMVTCGAWFYWSESNASSELLTGKVSVDPSQSLPDHQEEKGTRNDLSTEEEGQRIAAIKPDVVENKQPDGSKPVQLKSEDAKKVEIPKKQIAEKPKAPSPVKSTPKVKDSQSLNKKPAQKVPPKKSQKKINKKPKRVKLSKANASQRSIQSNRLYKKARQYHRQERFDEAISLYREVIKVNPDHFKARFNLCAAYLQTEAYSHAFPIIADLYEKDPTNQQVMLNMAIAHIGCHRYTEALQLLEKVSEQQSPPLFEIAFHRGVAYSHLNQAEKAINWYKRAEGIRPNDPNLLFNLAVISDQQQQYDKAVDYYSRHIEHHPDIHSLKKKQIQKRIYTLRSYHSGSINKE